MGSPLKSFTLFPKLPIELRLKIWRDSIQPRMVKVRYDKAHKRCTSFAIPAILHASRESRYVGLKTYQLCFGLENGGGGLYFNYDIDAVALNWQSFGRGPG